jgi:hypothetical protein
MFEEIGLLSGLASGDDGELGVAVCCADSTRGEMLRGVEVEDLGGLGVAESGVAGGSLG